MLTLNHVTSIHATLEDGVYILQCNITDANNDTYDCEYCSRPEDTFGLNPTIRQWLIDNEGNYTIEPYIPPPPPVVIVPAATFWGRMTDQEAEDIDTEMGTKSVRIRNLFRTATVYRSDADPWNALMAALVSLFGEPRALEILAP